FPECGVTKVEAALIVDYANGPASSSTNPATVTIPAPSLYGHFTANLWGRVTCSDGTRCLCEIKKLTVWLQSRWVSSED
ncbi:MAG: hypothetical protein JXA93_04895, partial [Anaerolineae bacterium]|nr:hypothetical protein [Anaerolineae bacterium]